MQHQHCPRRQVELQGIKQKFPKSKMKLNILIFLSFTFICQIIFKTQFSIFTLFSEKWECTCMFVNPLVNRYLLKYNTIRWYYSYFFLEIYFIFAYFKKCNNCFYALRKSKKKNIENFSTSNDVQETAKNSKVWTKDE